MAVKDGGCLWLVKAMAVYDWWLMEWWLLCYQQEYV